MDGAEKLAAAAVVIFIIIPATLMGLEKAWPTIESLLLGLVYLIFIFAGCVGAIWCGYRLFTHLRQQQEARQQSQQREQERQAAQRKLHELHAQVLNVYASHLERDRAGQ